MNYKEFLLKLIDLNLIKEFEFGFYDDALLDRSCDQGTAVCRPFPYHRASKKEVVPSDITHLEYSWTIGGKRGGTCWGNNPEYFTVSEPLIPEMNALEKIIEYFYPDARYLEVISLQKEILSEEFRTETEYYGNYNDIKVVLINLKKIYQWLKYSNKI